MCRGGKIRSAGRRVNVRFFFPQTPARRTDHRRHCAQDVVGRRHAARAAGQGTRCSRPPQAIETVTPWRPWACRRPWWADWRPPYWSGPSGWRCAAAYPNSCASRPADASVWTSTATARTTVRTGPTNRRPAPVRLIICCCWCVLLLLLLLASANGVWYLSGGAKPYSSYASKRCGSKKHQKSFPRRTRFLML